MDYYAEARAISSLLRNEDATELAETLDDAILAGATGTEILMALRFHLRNAQRGSISDTTWRRMNWLAGQIDRVVE